MRYLNWLYTQRGLDGNAESLLKISMFFVVLDVCLYTILLFVTSNHRAQEYQKESTVDDLSKSVIEAQR